MTQALLVSNAVLWMVVVLLACVVAALARQIGVLHERVAPAGALMVGKGPAVGESAPVVRVEDLTGTVHDLGGPGAGGRSTLLFFLSPTCPLCKTLLPVLRSIARREGDWLGIVLASDGARDEHEAFVRAERPLLPVARAATDEHPAVPDDAALHGEVGDPKSCNYWRHCAIDGFLCACCGGSQNTCPPGTEMSPLTWIGTCRNPGDGKDYIISYNDCCGQSLCMRCRCTRTEGERPLYLTMKNNDLLWCFGTQSRAVNCSVAVVLGVATRT